MRSLSGPGMTDSRKCFIPMVSSPLLRGMLLKNIDMTRGQWMIGDRSLETKIAGVTTTNVAKTLPHKIQEWQYGDGVKWQTDPLLTVTGNIIILRSPH